MTKARQSETYGEGIKENFSTIGPHGRPSFLGVHIAALHPGNYGDLIWTVASEDLEQS